MSDEFTLVAPRVLIPSETVVVPVEHGPLPGVTREVPDPEQMRAAEAAFTHDNQEAHAVAGVLGLWTGALLLHDLAAEHFEGRDEEEETLPRRRPGRTPEDGQ